VPLCQSSFAAIGAFTTAQLVNRYDAPVLVTIVAGTVLAAVVGAMLAVPALRLGGIYLSLATLAFALMFESVLVPLHWVSGGDLPLKVPRPLLGSIDFANEKAFFLLCLGVLALAAGVVILVRRGTTGRYLDALRGSEVAATAVGINPTRARITEAQTRRSLQFVQGLVERRRKKQSTVDITDDGGDVVQTHPEPVSR